MNPEDREEYENRVSPDMEYLQYQRENPDMTTNPTPTPQKKTRGEIYEILSELVSEIGYQVTRDYDRKNGLWEGKSISNEKSLLKRVDKLEALITRREQEVAKEIKKAIEYLPKDNAL